MSAIPYVPSYLRAVPPTIWPVVSPLDYGAIGNGSADDYPAIAAALHALADKGGGTLVFPNDRDFRIATPGVHGIHLRQQSNVTIMMGERSRLVMDNMAGGLAVSHGIFIEGPAENISLIGVHVRFAALSAARQTWAPVYFLGANLGTGDEGAGGWYRGIPGGERPDLIEAGAIRNVRLENVTCENSPSVGMALIGVDGAAGSNLTVRDTWADGIYLRSHRRVRIDGYYGWRVGDDGLSMGSEESSVALADIEHDFHGEGSTFSNIVLEERPVSDPPPSGSVVLLGVRDTTIANVVCIDRYRGLRIESGTHHTLGYPGLNLNFLASRRVTVSDLSLDRCVQDIAILPLECNAGTDDKWWRHDMLVSGVVGENGGAALDIYGPGIPLDGGPPLPIWGGITFRNMKFTGYANVSQTLVGMVDCTFDGFETDTTISIQGFVPYGIDPDLLDGGGRTMFIENRSTFRNFRGSTILVQGLKRCWFDALESSDALRDAIVFLNCADIDIGAVRVRYPNRIDDPIANGALTFDEFCKRCSVQALEVEQDGKAVHSLGFRSAGKHRAGLVRVKTSQSPAAPYVTLISDRAWIDGKVSQVGRAEWMHDGSGDWGARDFPNPPATATHGNADVQIYVEGNACRHRLVQPLSANRTWTLYDARAAVGDRIDVVREPTSSGNWPVTFEGLAPVGAAAPQSDPNPAGMSDIALRRRTEAMLSSAIRHGSTAHMEPHWRQVSGDAALGVPPLAWHVGDTLGNIQSLIDVSLASLASKVPEFQRARYDFATRTFRTGEGKPLSDEALDRWVAGKGRDREAGAGSATYKRGILLNTLVRAPGGERSGLLELVLSRARQRLGASLGDIFYQGRDAPSVLGPRGSVTFTREDRERLTAVIALFKNRNRSTVLHETGHLWLEELQADAALPHAPEALKADLATVRAYLGAAGDAPLSVEQHEKWARTVEAYFLEGRSPSVALSAVLARFKAWLLSIYRTAKSLNVDIDDDIRGVLDRMIATDEAIAEAQAEVHAGAAPASVIAAAMTEAERQAHAESVAHSRELARRTVLAASMGDIHRRRTPQWKAEARALGQEIQRTIDSQPDIVALRYLRDGTLPDSLAHLRGLPRLRLSRAALIEEHGHRGIADSLPRSFERLVVDKDGVRPAEIARLLGFPDGRSMIDALTMLAEEQAALRRAGDRRSVRRRRIDDAVERAMVERHGPALFDGSIEGEALSGLHNEARATVLGAEVRALARQAGRVGVSYQEAREWARYVIEQEAEGKIGDLRLLTRAEARAAFAADEALARGDIDGALQRKQEQMIAHALWRETRDANQRAEVARRKMERRAAGMMDATSDGAVEDDVRALPSAGSSEGGPGMWRKVKEGMKPRAAAYQRQITGETGKAYFVKGGKFDGFLDGMLLEVKGPGYASLMKNGEFKKRLRAREKLLKQANDQVEAANGVPIVWHIAESPVAEATRKLLRLEKVKGIKVLTTPAVPWGS